MAIPSKLTSPTQLRPARWRHQNHFACAATAWRLDFPLPRSHIPRKFEHLLAATMKRFWLQFFTWWNGETLGTRFYTWRFGKPVGQDELGNRYYRAEGPLIDRSVGSERRWVIYNGVTDASRVPPGWRAWLTHNASLPPSEAAYRPHEWEKGHLPNMTGTALAYHPPGSQLGTGQRPAATGDYVPWSPTE